MGMKIVLSGTDSLGFWLAMDEELYDRAKPIHTTFIPYREYILLVFMYDRLGRNLNETPFIAEWFTKKGIHVWSVYEGEIIDGVDAERMLDYIRFWQTDEAQKL